MVGQNGTRPGGLGSDFHRMVKMSVEIDRMILRQDLGQVYGDPLGHYHRDSASNLIISTLGISLKALRIESNRSSESVRIAARYQHIPNVFVPAYVFAGFDPLPEMPPCQLCLPPCVSYSVYSTLSTVQLPKQNSVRIAVYQTFYG